MVHRGQYLVPKLLGPLQLPLHSVQLLAQLLSAVLRLPPVMLQDVQEDALRAWGPRPACLLGVGVQGCLSLWPRTHLECQRKGGPQPSALSPAPLALPPGPRALTSLDPPVLPALQGTSGVRVS